MSTTTTTTTTPKLKLKTTFDNTITTTTAMPSFVYTYSQRPTIQQKLVRKCRLQHKHLRKPPSLDTYIRSNDNDNNISNGSSFHNSRKSSLSSSCSSTSSDDNPSYAMFANGDLFPTNSPISSSLQSIQPHRARRSSATVKLVRFAGSVRDDGSSIASSSTSSSSADDYDPHETEESEDDEEFFYVTPLRTIPSLALQRHHHRKSYSD